MNKNFVVVVKNPVRPSLSFSCEFGEQDTTVDQVKHYLSEKYPGCPSPDDQRIILNGRILRSTETLSQISQMVRHGTVDSLVKNERPTTPSSSANNSNCPSANTSPVRDAVPPQTPMWGPSSPGLMPGARLSSSGGTGDSRTLPPFMPNTTPPRNVNDMPAMPFGVPMPLPMMGMDPYMMAMHLRAMQFNNMNRNGGNPAVATRRDAAPLDTRIGRSVSNRMVAPDELHPVQVPNVPERAANVQPQPQEPNVEHENIPPVDVQARPPGRNSWQMGLDVLMAVMKSLLLMTLVSRRLPVWSLYYVAFIVASFFLFQATYPAAFSRGTNAIISLLRTIIRGVPRHTRLTRRITRLSERVQQTGRHLVVMMTRAPPLAEAPRHSRQVGEKYAEFNAILERMNMLYRSAGTVPSDVKASVDVAREVSNFIRERYLMRQPPEDDIPAPVIEEDQIPEDVNAMSLFKIVLDVPTAFFLSLLPFYQVERRV